MSKLSVFAGAVVGFSILTLAAAADPVVYDSAPLRSRAPATAPCPVGDDAPHCLSNARLRFSEARYPAEPADDGDPVVFDLRPPRVAASAALACPMSLVPPRCASPLPRAFSAVISPLAAFAAFPDFAPRREAKAMTAWKRAARVGGGEQDGALAQNMSAARNGAVAAAPAPVWEFEGVARIDAAAYDSGAATASIADPNGSAPHGRGYVRGEDGAYGPMTPSAEHRRMEASVLPDDLGEYGDGYGEDQDYDPAAPTASIRRIEMTAADAALAAALAAPGDVGDYGYGYGEDEGSPAR